ncbi:movement protein [Grapevine virus M]|nr:movement protein [Grapevine virus M]
MSHEVRVFRVRKSTANFGELNKQLNTSKVYDQDVVERLFPRSVVKGNVHTEIVVKNGKVDVDLDLLGPDGGEALLAFGKPYVHVGCIAVALMPHGKNLPGVAHLVLRDGRLLSGKDILCRFQCRLDQRLSAFAEFPNYFVSTEDITKGFSFHLSIQSDELGFRDGTHPFSVQLTSILRGCDESMDMRYALSTLGSGLYQAVLNSSPETEKPGLIKYQNNEVTSVMAEVYETIKKLNLEHNGELHKERSDEGDNQDVAINWSDASGKT